MKKIIFLFVFIILFGLSIYYHEEITDFLVSNLANQFKNSSKLVNNDYALEEKFGFVNITDNFSPKNKQDIKDIYYTVINSGMNDFTFYCDSNYKECLDDVNEISNDQKLLSHFNNFVHIFNSFRNIDTEFDTLGKVNIHITHNYNKDQIDEINVKFKTIIDETIKDDDNVDIKIKKYHDYIINNTKYDTKKSDKKISTYHSDIAYGALIEGYAVCGGYSDSMKLFLDYYNIPNFKISSENHIWNVVYVKDKWLHLDLTWDDPVTSTGEDILDYNYFLVTTNELLEHEKEQHGFSYDIYQELKEN